MVFVLPALLHAALLVAASRPLAASCTPIANVGALLTRSAVTFFGEMHGTAESPAFVANVLCHAAAARIPVVLALELPNASTPSLEAYVHSRGAATDRQALLADSAWHEVPRDGRTSQAMLALLDSARRLVASGADLHVLAFSRSASTGQARDSAMAETLAEAIARTGDRVVIGLTGNIHSRTAVGTSFDISYRPMAYLLRTRLGDRVRGLNVTYDSGTAWVCMSGPGGDSCGRHAINGRRLVPVNTIDLDAHQHAYDGLYGVPALTASPPAAPD